MQHHYVFTHPLVQSPGFTKTHEKGSWAAQPQLAPPPLLAVSKAGTNTLPLRLPTATSRAGPRLTAGRRLATPRLYTVLRFE